LRGATCPPKLNERRRKRRGNPASQAKKVWIASLRSQ
jgi:hypothetical protein